MQLLYQLEIVAAAAADRGRGPFSYAVDGQDGGVLERGGEERARGMGFVVLGVQQFTVVLQGAPDLAIEEQLFLDPERARHAELGEASRRHTEVRLEDPLELEQRLVVEADVREIADRNGARREAVADCMDRKRRIPLFPRKPLLLGRRHDLAVAQQAGGAVVIERGDAKDVSRGHGRRARAETKTGCK